MSSDRRVSAVLPLLRPQAGRWAALGVLTAFGAGLTVIGPLVVRSIVDRAVEGTDADTIRRLAFVFLVIVIAAQVVSVLVARSATYAAWATTNELRMRMARHVLGLDHEFHRQHTPGELIQRVDGDVTSVSDLLGRVLPKAVGSAILVAGMVIVVSAIDWRIGVGMAVYVVAAVAAVLVMRHRAVEESADEMGAYARLYGGIEERLNASEDLRANGAGSHAMWRFVEDSAGALDRSVRRESAFLGMWWGVQGAVVGGVVASVLAGAVLVSNGAITVGTAFLLFQYVLLIQRPLEEVVHELETVQKATGAMRRVLALMQVEPTVLDHGRTSPAAGPLAIEFSSVSFDYGDDDPVLHDVDLTLQAGRSVGVVGRTGSGKTTFSRLVLRLVEATAGQVNVGGVPIADVPMRELRRRAALVPQEVELFNGTIRENVTLFDSRHSDAAVADALHSVGLGALADGGIDRPLGGGGAGLSAGEAQLLAMARVWLRDPDLVVLDEATARVDPVTERRIEEAMRELMRGRTTIVIAHRLSTLSEVDDIAVFEAGRIVEFGARETLVADPDGRFRRLLDLALEPDRAPSEGMLA
ncbi:ATP-binding cassette subfamily B protein/ATP-binding cassette subfamily C protein [Ilumatobacter fluminis]|uniref:ATP-binding cassette subfamily B protein/ATP-binding cassette subfamily C protein n=1 Tax=Ilumatobacter fluminis TaxID=467091 RepID=A0A4R7HZS5_9ACTN|nr:ATP-binding cassette subfamily B protein/ATP-binding cassette subfamily C protein [Ilumatobacter fluminis]